MKKHEAKSLISKYAKGETTPDENILLEQFFLKDLTKNDYRPNQSRIAEADKRISSTLMNHIGANYSERKTIRLWAGIAAAASVILCLSIGLLYYHHPGNHKLPQNAVVISSKAGERKSLTLPDGTVVTLNGETKISYLLNSFNKNNRRIELTGEAYFAVVHNALKPFIVHTAKMDIKDVGTIFNIKAYSGDRYTEASLIKGAIELTVTGKKNHPIILHPGEKILVDNFMTLPIPGASPNHPKASQNIYQVTKITTNPIAKTIVETDWVNNRLTFNDESFGDMANQMERWYDVKISFENQSIKKYRFVATFNNESLTQVLEVLKLTRDFNYRKEAGMVVIY